MIGINYFLEHYQTAETYINRATRLYNNVANNNIAYIKYLLYKGNLQAQNWKWEEAEKNHQLAINLSQKLFGENSTEHAFALYHISYLYYRMSLTNDAEKQIVKALEIQKNSWGDNSPTYAKYLSHFVRNQFRMDIYNLGEPTLKKIIAIQKANLPPNHVEYIIAVGNLGYLYSQKGKLKLADSLTTYTIPLYKEVYSLKGARYINSLINSSDIKQQLKDYKAADSLLSFYLSIISTDSLQLNNHTNTVVAANSLGWLNYKLCNFQKADSCFKLGYTIIEKYSGYRNRDFLNSCNGLAHLNLTNSNFSKAEDYVLKNIDIEKNLLLDKLEFLTQVELLNYITEREKTINLPYTLLQKANLPLLVKQVYNNKLLIAGITLQNSSQLIKEIYQCNDSSITKLWNNYQTAKFELIKITAFPNADKNPLLDSITNNANLQEKELLRLSSNYRNMKQKLNITWKDIKSNLKPNEVAIEFVAYNYFNKEFTNTNNYAAMLITPTDTAPVFVYLTNQNQLEKALKIYAYKGAIRGNSKNNMPQLHDVYKLLWQPLAPYLTQTKTIYFAPDGLLHQLAFAAIPYKKDSLLCHKYNLVQLTSTREIINQNSQQNVPNTITLFGGINYNKQLFDTTTASINSFYAFAKKRGGLPNKHFSYLPYTLSEVKNIEQHLLQFNKKVSVIAKEKATESMFKSLAGNQSPHIIHLATHAFTLPKITKIAPFQKTNTFISSNNPLLRCGLVMAGGNKGWIGKNKPTQDDGILTGEEISITALPNTKLVILSACETGLGKIQGTEGVFGLQRAFKIAGANYVMASLWQVPDKETAIFMQTFYKFWFSKKAITIDEAFIKTQRKMSNTYDPYFWAGFTLVH